jgi:hypothetical protein
VHPVVGFRPCKAYAVRFQLDSSKWLIETEGMMGAGTGEEAREVFDPPMSYPVVPTRLAQSRRLRSYVHHRAHYSENYAGIATSSESVRLRPPPNLPTLVQCTHQIRLTF